MTANDITRGDDHLRGGQYAAAEACYRTACAGPQAHLAERRLQQLLLQSGRLSDDTSSPHLAATLALQQVVVIYYYGRSGSVFVQSLLDHHPQTLGLPGVGLERFHLFWESVSQLSGPALVDSFMSAFAPLWDASRPATRWCRDGDWLGFRRMGPDKDEVLSIPEELLRRHLLELVGEFEVVSRRFFFQALHAAWGLTLHGSLEGRSQIVYHLHGAFERGQDTLLEKLSGRVNPLCKIHRALQQDFPQALHLHTLRQPLQTVQSFFTATLNYATYGAYTAAMVIGQGILGGEPVLPEAAAHSRGIRLEDLHAESESTLRRLIAWLGLEWSPWLVRSTFQGREWWNLAQAPIVNGFRAASQLRPDEETLNPLDELRLKVLLAPKFQAWGYALPASFSQSWARWAVLPLLLLPFRMERLAIRAELRGCAPASLKWKRILKGLLHLRWVTLLAWLELWAPRRHEVPLI